MSFESLEARKAQLFDAAEIIRIQDEGESWNLAKGFIPLAFSYSAQERKEFLRKHLAESDIYLFKQGTETVGLVRIQMTDPVFWGDAGWDPLAHYIHGLTIGEAWHGEGLGKWILNWAENFIREKGMKFARLDCMKSNASLCRYYESAGYRDKGEVALKSGWVSKKYEKSLG